jgi:hypothetical protein
MRMNRKDTQLLVENWRNLLKGEPASGENTNEIFKGKYLGKDPVKEINKILEAQIASDIASINAKRKDKDVHEFFHNVSDTVRNLNFKFEIYKTIKANDLKLTKVPKKLNLDNVVFHIYSGKVPENFISFDNDINTYIDSTKEASKKINSSGKGDDFEIEKRLNRERFSALFHSILDSKGNDRLLKLNIDDGYLSKILKEKISIAAHEQNIEIDKSYPKHS